MPVRGGICPCRHCRRQRKIFASSVNFSICTHFLCFFLTQTVEIRWNRRCKIFSLKIRRCKILDKFHVCMTCSFLKCLDKNKFTSEPDCLTFSASLKRPEHSRWSSLLLVFARALVNVAPPLSIILCIALPTTLWGDYQILNRRNIYKPGGWLHCRSKDCWLILCNAGHDSLPCLPSFDVSSCEKHRKNCECCPGHYLSTSVY